MSLGNRCVLLLRRPYRPASMVLILLVGILGMHGVGAGAGAAGAVAASWPAESDHTRQSVMAAAMHHDCSHVEDGGGHGSHNAHAENLCMSAAPPQGPAFPALPAHRAEAMVSAAPTEPVAAATDRGRSPPFLVGLQILRI